MQVQRFMPIPSLVRARVALSEGKAQPGRVLRRVRSNPERRARIAAEYMAAPTLEEEAVPFWDALADDVCRQADYLTEVSGLGFEVVDDDPYGDALQMAAVVRESGVLQVMATGEGDHPYWSAEVNEVFRFVHDAIGHLSTGCGFDRHGEEAAFRAHVVTMSPDAQVAAATELRGQNAALIETGGFQDQRVAVLRSALTPVARMAA